MESERDNSVDEYIIPAKRRYSGIQQYNPKTWTKWRRESFVRAGKSSSVYSFFIYTGTNNIDREKYTSEPTVLQLDKHIQNINSTDYFLILIF